MSLMNLITERKKNMPRKNLDRSMLIIDGSNLAHRAYHKFKNLRYKDQKVGMVYGFLRLLQQYIIRFRCKYVLVTFDSKQSKSSNFRNSLLGSYKIHRKDNLRIDFEDFNNQMKITKKILKYLNVPVIYDKVGLGHESDDYIGYFALLHSSTHSKVTILSSDKDFCQLITNDVKIFNPFKEALITPRNCKEIMGYSPEECVDYLCLLGDHSDDIPGYKGIGEKKTREFLDKFGSIENFLNDESLEFRGIDREGLEDLYKRNKELIDVKVALERHPLKKIPIIYHRSNKVDKEKSKELFIKYGFISFLNPEFIRVFENLTPYRNHEPKN